MIFKNTWVWIILALALLGASIWHFERSRHGPNLQKGLLSQLHSASVTSVQTRFGPQLKIRAEKTNGVWRLTEPVSYPAEGQKVDQLVAALEHLRPAIYISPRELMNRPNAQEEYGFATPQSTVIVNQGDYRAIVELGSRTAPGDQVFLQIIGDEGIYVVDAWILSLIPKNADDWRSTSVLNLKNVAFDRITITNSGKGFELRRTSTNQWQILTSDFSPRADGIKVEDFIQKMTTLRAERFIPEERGADLELFGLQNPEFQFAVAQGTNSLCMVQFGKSITNDSMLVYARNTAKSVVLLVNCTNAVPWPTLSTFRDTHLLGGLPPPDIIEVRGKDQFKLSRETNDSWTISPQKFAVDASFMKDLLHVLWNIQILDFVKDVVPPQALGEYGLDHPSMEYILHLAGGGPNTDSNGIHLQFSTNRDDKVLARRSDEPSIYRIKAQQTQYLPRASFAVRDRHIWKYSIEELVGVTLEQGSTNCHLLRKGDHQWTVAPGSKGIIEPLAVEETLLDLVNLTAIAWLPHETSDMSQYGFEYGQRITLEFKNGEQKTIQMAQSMPQNGIGAVKIDGETWVFAIGPALRRDVATYLSVPRQSTL